MINRDNKLLTVKQVSRYFSLSERTIQRLSKQGNIKCIKLGGQWKFYKKDIEEYLRYGTDFSKGPARKINDFVERRTSSRINCSLPCYIKVIIPQKKELFSQTRILNISKGGVFLENSGVSPKILNDDPISLEFKLDNNRINVDGRILRTGPNGAGVKFRNAPKEIRKKISMYIGQ